jgi:hypothetical protein
MTVDREAAKGTDEMLSENDDATLVCEGFSVIDSALPSHKNLAMNTSMGEEENESQAHSSTLEAGRRKSLRVCKGKKYQEFMNVSWLSRGKQSFRKESTNDG